MNIHLTLYLQRIRRLLAAAVLIVLSLSASFSIINYLVRTFAASAVLKDVSARFFYGFYVGAEYNFPTWCSSFMLLASAFVIVVVAYIHHARGSGYLRHWRFLAGLFALFSLDEYTGLHEAAGSVFSTFVGKEGIFYYSWPILGILGIGAVAITYWRFVTALPTRTRRLFILSAVILVGGAIGVEMVQGYYAYLYGPGNVGYEFISYVEELMEFSGMALFLYTFISQLEIELEGKDLSLSIR